MPMGLSPQERYLEKPFVGSSHSWALRRCDQVPTDAKVLDIGPGSGYIGRSLKAHGFSRLYAVEIDPRARQHVTDIYHRVEASLDSFAQERFDLVLLLDVLEHTSEPENFLHQVSHLVTPGGNILVSVPNIAHWSIRLALLFGYFEPMDRGLLDRTHLQCLTRRRFRSMLASCPHTSIAELSASIVPLELMLPDWVWRRRFFTLASRARLAAARAWPSLLAYQHLGRLVRSPD